MRNELNELATFAVIARERSFTRAAAKIGVSQSALSHTIRGLEQRLELQLLARTTKSVAPTAAGAALLKELSPALEQIARAINKARNVRHRPAGRLRIVMSRSAAVMVLLPRLTAFAEATPTSFLTLLLSLAPSTSLRVSSTPVFNWRVHSERHDRGAGHPGVAIGGGRIARLFFITKHSPETQGSK